MFHFEHTAGNGLRLAGEQGHIEPETLPGNCRYQIAEGNANFTHGHPVKAVHPDHLLHAAQIDNNGSPDVGNDIAPKMRRP